MLRTAVYRTASYCRQSAAICQRPPGSSRFQAGNWGVTPHMKMFRRRILTLLLAFTFVPLALGQSIPQAVDKILSPSSTANGAQTQVVDPLGRSTPRGTVVGFLQAAQSGNYKLAADYLQLTKNQRASHGENLARDLHMLMDRAFTGKVNMISEKREGSVQVGVPADRERIGVFQVDSSEYDVVLAREVDPTVGDVWLFSSTTLDDVPDLAGQLKIRSVEPGLPTFLVSHRILSAPLWIWVAFLLLIPIAYGVSWLLIRFARIGKHSWGTWRNHPEREFCGKFSGASGNAHSYRYIAPDRNRIPWIAAALPRLLPPGSRSRSSTGDRMASISLDQPLG